MFVSRIPFLRYVSFFVMLTVCVGCAVNPVTGKRELALISEKSEIALGDKHYDEMQQSQHGLYVVDMEVQKYVNEMGQKIAATSGRPNLPYDFVVVNDSIPNAWALPGGKIAIHRGLLVELGNEAELAAVLGHEIVHAAARHTARRIQKGLIVQTALIGVTLLTRESKHQPAIGATGQIMAILLMQGYSRSDEFEADSYGMRYMAAAGYDPRAAISLQEMFMSLSEAKDSLWLAGLFASHPPSYKRVEANKKTAGELEQKGYFGEKEYKKALAAIFDAREAYKQYDEGVKALAKGDGDGAEVLARKALREEPREPLFYNLLGKALYKKKEYRRARDAFGKGIERYDGYYDLYLQRGKAYRKLEEKEKAREDLERSTELFPSAAAYYNLGVIEDEDGDTAEAWKYMEAAANSSSYEGKKALVWVAEREITSKPEKYISHSFFKTHRKTLGVEIYNRSPLDVKAMNITVSVDGVVRAISLEALAAGERKRIESDVYIGDDAEGVRFVSISVSR
jgi:beta-barrel assembly-enhancing protease